MKKGETKIIDISSALCEPSLEACLGEKALYCTRCLMSLLPQISGSSLESLPRVICGCGLSFCSSRCYDAACDDSHWLSCTSTRLSLSFFDFVKKSAFRKALWMSYLVLCKGLHGILEKIMQPDSDKAALTRNFVASLSSVVDRFPSSVASKSRKRKRRSDGDSDDESDDEENSDIIDAIEESWTLLLAVFAFEKTGNFLCSRSPVAAISVESTTFREILQCPQAAQAWKDLVTCLQQNLVVIKIESPLVETAKRLPTLDSAQRHFIYDFLQSILKPTGEGGGGPSNDEKLLSIPNYVPPTAAHTLERKITDLSQAASQVSENPFDRFALSICVLSPTWSSLKHCCNPNVTLEAIRSSTRQSAILIFFSQVFFKSFF